MNVASSGNREYIVSVLECKSDVGGRSALVQALRYYQKHYKDGSLWQTQPNSYGCDPLPALALLLEGPRLSIHAVWTIYQNRVGYAPLTPSYYLANEGRNTANVWKLVDVIAAYKRVSEDLRKEHMTRDQLDPEARRRMADLRRAAHAVRSEIGTEEERPCTLPYSLLDSGLGLSEISFVGGKSHLLYKARMDAGNEAQQVLIKFAAGGYGEQVHKAWCKKGVAPKLFDVRQVGGSGSPFTMVVMEHLRPEDGWKPLHDALEQCKWRGDSCAPLKEAVLEALRTAHEVDDDGRKAVHGDARGPNILVHMGDTATESAGDIRVRFIDFDWAGFEDDAARYPRVRLSPKVKWHASVAPDAPMQQVQDSFLLERELERYA